MEQRLARAFQAQGCLREALSSEEVVAGVSWIQRQGSSPRCGNAVGISLQVLLLVGPLREPGEFF